MDFIESITNLLFAIAGLIDALVLLNDRLISRRGRSDNGNTGQPPTSSQRQIGLLDQNLIRRLFLLANTALGLVLIINAVDNWRLAPFILGNGIILCTSVFILVRYNQGVVRQNRFKWWFFGLIWFISLWPKEGGRGCCWDWQRLDSDGEDINPKISYFFFGNDYDNYHLGYWICLIVYILYIFIECW